MPPAATRPPITLSETFSFYVPSSDNATLEVVGSMADGVTVKGPRGPQVIRNLRASGWDTPVIFDYSGYDPKTPRTDARRWFDEQAAAGADRLLSTGTWLGWDPGADLLQQAIETEAARCEHQPNATALFAIEHRWLTKAPMDLAAALNDLGRPAALVLAHPTDPLSPTNAVQGLIALTRTVEGLTILRTDHGGFGALVYGARHAAVGMIGSYRHFVPPGRSGGGKINAPTARVFVRPLMDWFTALTIAGWTTAKVNLAPEIADDTGHYYSECAVKEPNETAPRTGEGAVEPQRGVDTGLTNRAASRSRPAICRAYMRRPRVNSVDRRLGRA